MLPCCALWLSVADAFDLDSVTVRSSEAVRCVPVAVGVELRSAVGVVVVLRDVDIDTDAETT